MNFLNGCLKELGLQGKSENGELDFEALVSEVPIFQELFLMDVKNANKKVNMSVDWTAIVTPTVRFAKLLKKYEPRLTINFLYEIREGLKRKFSWLGAPQTKDDYSKSFLGAASVEFLYKLIFVRAAFLANSYWGFSPTEQWHFIVVYSVCMLIALTAFYFSHEDNFLASAPTRGSPPKKEYTRLIAIGVFLASYVLILVGGHYIDQFAVGFFIAAFAIIFEHTVYNRMADIWDWKKLGPAEESLRQVTGEPIDMAFFLKKRHLGYLEDSLIQILKLFRQQNGDRAFQFLNHLLTDGKARFVTRLTPFWKGDEGWTLSSQNGIVLSRKVMLENGIAQKGTGGYGIANGVPESTLPEDEPLGFTSDDSPSHRIEWGASLQETKKEFINGLAFAHLWMHIWGTDRLPPMSLPVGITKVTYLPKGDREIPLKQYAYDWAEEHLYDEFDLIANFLGKKLETPEQATPVMVERVMKEFLEQHTPAQLTTINESPARFDLLRFTLEPETLATYAALLEKHQRSAGNKKEMIDMLDVLLAHLFPDDGKARAADIRGESAWEILENLHKRLQALDSHPDNYRSIMRQLGKIVGTAWAVGGTFDGESTAHRNLGLRINTSEPRQEVIVHDFDGAFIPSLQSQTDDLVKFTGTVSNGNVDVGSPMIFFQLNFVEQLLRNLYRVPPKTPLGNDFWEGVQEAAEQAAQKVWRNPEQEIVSKEYLEAFRRWIDETTYIKGPDPIELDIFLKLMRAALNKAGNNVKEALIPPWGHSRATSAKLQRRPRIRH